MASVSIKLPDIGEGVTQAEVVEWMVGVGDRIEEDAPLLAVMTDKATVEIPSLCAGTVTWVAGEVGDVIAIGAEVVRIESDGAAGQPEPGIGDSPAGVPSPSAAAPAKSAAAASDAKAAESSSPPAMPLRSPVAPLGIGAPRAEGWPVLASPSVRARARAGGIDLRQVAGSGPGGRISHADLDAVFAVAGARTSAGPAWGRSTSAPGARTATKEIKVIGLRRKIAERMTLANSRIPHITVIEEIDVTALEDLREKLNAGRGDRPKLTVLPFVTAALARAFVDHPGINAHFDDEGGTVMQHAAVHLGIATMTDTGLVVPVIRHAEALGLFDAAAEIARLAEAARTGKAGREELSGSTFTVTSLGPLGAVATTPIINHPEVAILGINKMAVRPMWDGARFQPRKMMNISASFDHRVIDGWDAAVFVQKLKTLLETPALIFVSERP
ncbi:branched-chain alpha-keto acid dehydrogenase E2 component [Novosphingobium sp. CF614]|uniref:dihydrolipoamide acetyltransferase family protein n=1 Tax=Novosphingobium sp. CF614 TaxID=1884364 RepID=UPI0008EBF326|nr:dihydrolipoamide acetyltransferase family protein [Novosphingobium sp. CF614]SFG52317.1 branched-chain alpha-keto acid dehydrogenase E2 component [Novosphingobium sp. CF614]